MKKIIDRLRLQWLMATKTMGYSADATERMYRIYLNHGKVIHYRKGRPVYSLSSPALFTGPSANFFARQLYKSIHGKNTPNLLSFAVTSECNAACGHCSFYKDEKKDGRPPVTLEQAVYLIRSAQELGVSVINFTGGEPLLRGDLPEIIKSVDKELSTTAMFTNGWYLKERCAELKAAGLDSLYVSVDSADPKTHDKLRGVEGLFARAAEGIGSALSAGFSVGISCCVSPESFRDGELDRVIELAKKLGVHEVIVYDAAPTGRYAGREDLQGNTAWLEELIASVGKYNEDSSYPGVLVYAYTTSHRSVGCSSGVNYFYLSPWGDVCPCDFNHMCFGNALQEPLYRIWDRMTSLPDFSCAKWGYCRMKDPAFKDCKTISREFKNYDRILP
ncbi:MAG TPA: radical SAM protein [Elusimicrobiales bacterium]|nr:radical SAM protein [Elusimicrobiales bacterium]